MRTGVLLLDLFHTLVHVRAGTPTWSILGVPKDAYEESFYDDRDGRAEGLVRDPVECMRMVAHAIDPDIPMSRIRTATETREVRFADAFTKLPHGVEDGIRRLSESGVRLGLVSNVMHGEAVGWVDSAIAAHFETAVFSCDVGIVKPDRGIYDLALEALGTPPEQAWFAGDGGSDELRGARDIGLTSVLVTHVLDEIAPHRVVERRAHAHHVVRGIDDLADLVLETASA